jgi:hypothetical protein
MRQSSFSRNEIGDMIEAVLSPTIPQSLRVFYQLSDGNRTAD